MSSVMMQAVPSHPTADSVSPTIARPDLDLDQERLTRLLPPYRVVVLNRPTMHAERSRFIRSSVGSTTTKPDLDEERLTRLLPPYKVVVLDCNCHTFDDVETALCRVIQGMTREKAHQHAYEIHTTGASVVARAPKERAELYQQRLLSFGLRVIIEPD